MIPSRYSSSQLREINARIANKLPPATAVHGMAMYELQRDGEQERLFHAAMFDVSQLRQTSTAQQSKIDSLEHVVKACAGHHDNARSASLAGGKHVIAHCDEPRTSS
jgi:cob(I)alamin adenosyltransferase